MKNIFDYLEFYGNTSFSISHFNEVDCLIFSLLSYVEFESIVPSNKKRILLSEACSLFLDKFKNVNFKKKNWLFANSYKLIKSLENSKRYSYTYLSHYINVVDENGQFGALTIRVLDDYITYLSYSGTDSNIVGWREDFDMVCNYPIYSQGLAKDYFNSSLSIFDENVFIGGHSKGGNLAMYAYMYGNARYKKKVRNVYNFDGPGFLEDVLSLERYKEMSQKLVHIVPEDSIVGMLLEHDSYVPVVSSAKSILEHDAFTWECFGGYLVRGKLSSKSERFKKQFKEFLEQMTMDEKQDFVDNLFQVFHDLNISDIMQLKDYSLTDVFAFLKELTEIPSITKKHLMTIFRLLIGVIR